MRILDRGLHQGVRVQRFGLPLCGAFGEIKEGIQHALHIIDVLQQRLRIVFVDHRQAKPHPRQGRAQVMADPRQHQGALFNLPLDPCAHIDKGRPRRTHLDSACRGIWHVTPAAKGFGRAGQPLDRAQLVAQVNEGDQRHDKAKAEGIHKQLMRVLRRDPAPLELEIKRAKARLHIKMHPRGPRQIKAQEGWQILIEPRHHHPTGIIIPRHPVARRHLTG